MFDHSIHASHYDQNLIHGTLGHIRKMEEIIQVDFYSFQCVIFRCKWWDTFDHNNVKEDHDSGFISVNSRKMWHEARECYVSNTATKCFFTQMCWIEVGGSY